MLVLLHWPEDRWYAESVISHGVLSRDERWRDPLDPIAYLHDLDYDVWLDWGMWPIPEGDELVDIDDDTPVWDPADLSTLDGGERILIGDDWEVWVDGSAW